MLYDTLGTGSKIGWTRVGDEGHRAGFEIQGNGGRQVGAG